MKRLTTHDSQFTAVLILGHGSPVSKANNTLFEVAEAVRIKGGYDIVQPAFLQFEHPNFAEAVDIIVGMGAQQIIVHPYFLYMGAHVTKDLPFEIGTAKRKYPDIEFILTPHLGYHEKLVDIAVERIESVKNKKSEVRSQKSEENRITPFPTSHIPHPTSQPLSQHPIEAESFRIIGEQLDESRFSSLELPIVKRIIHTTADFEYVEIVRFGNNAIEAGMDAISKGADIITDVKMVEVGISKERLDKFGGKVGCFVADEDVVCQAKMNNVTRTAMGIRKALSPTSHIPHPTSKIVVIG
ncbi:MAG: precorrin-8X methylmutase, partial [Deltaproteobacteria bacterium]